MSDAHRAMAAGTATPEFARRQLTTGDFRPAVIGDRRTKPDLLDGVQCEEFSAMESGEIVMSER
jgi:hypothetical protein